jgi:hypothetical protein
MSHRRRPAPFATQASQLAHAVPQVVAHRMASMLSLQPTAGDREEMQLMSHEKLEAFGESWAAMQAQMWVAQQSLTTSMVSAWSNPWTFGAPALMQGTQDLHEAALGVLGSGLAPVHRRAVANAKRLGARRR